MVVTTRVASERRKLALGSARQAPGGATPDPPAPPWTAQGGTPRTPQRRLDSHATSLVPFYYYCSGQNNIFHTNPVSGFAEH